MVRLHFELDDNERDVNDARSYFNLFHFHAKNNLLKPHYQHKNEKNYKNLSAVDTCYFHPTFYLFTSHTNH